MLVRNNVIITTSHSSRHYSQELLDFAGESGWPLVERRHRSIPLLKAVYGAENIVVWENDRPILYTASGEQLFFHPSMAKNRLSFYRKQGQCDMMMKAIDLLPGDSFLDCTFGLGSDAIVASYLTRHGVVMGLESSPALAYVVSWGMKNYHSRMPWLDDAVHRIRLLNREHGEFLAALPDNSYDVVYFDPMFREPITKSVSMNPLRPLTNPRALEPENIHQALRSARKRVVIKERLKSGELERLGCQRIQHSKNNSIAYGILEK